jgi:hypothetical protein
MANSHDLFLNFDEVIKLSSANKANLRRSRNGLRANIREKFREKGYEVKFHQQGSLAMGTIIDPKDDDYDIDDGTYILQDKQPGETIETLHRWVMEAAQDYTTIEPKDRGPCVRVFFKAGYHVDLVVYYKREHDHPKLAHKWKGWMTSDPKEFMEWFKDKCKDKPQLSRIVRYFKAWGDNLRGDMPPGLIFTILATNHYCAHDRDDVAFLETMKRVHTSLKISFTCYRPTTPFEDLVAEYSDTRKHYILDRLGAFVDSGTKAIEEPNQKESCKKWQRHFGERFSCLGAKEELEDAKAFGAPAFIKSDARSA